MENKLVQRFINGVIQWFCCRYNSGHFVCVWSPACNIEWGDTAKKTPKKFLSFVKSRGQEFTGVAWGICQKALDLEVMEKKGLRVNAGKTKIMNWGTGLDLLQSSGEFPCTVCRTGVLWVHKKCSGLKRLKKDPDYRCTRCRGTACPLDGRPQKEVQVGPDKLEVVASFCYLGDMLSAAGGCELLTTTRVKTSWKKFKDLLPVHSSRHLPFKTRGRVYSYCVRSAMLHASKTWPLTKPNLQHLQRNDRAMIRQICNVRLQDIVTTRSNELLARLGIEDLDLILQRRLHITVM